MAPIPGRGQAGNVLVYILIAIALLAALTYSFTKDTRSSVSAQMANKNAQELFVQVNLIRAAILECTLAYPAGGGDMHPAGTPDGDIDADDNPNNPFPLNPTTTWNPGGAKANDQVSNLVCPGAPSATRNMFSGTNNQGRYLPPVPPGFGEWTYINHGNVATPTTGVRIQIMAPSNAGGIDTLNRLVAKFGTCQADINYGACGTNCFTAWIQRASCP